METFLHISLGFFLGVLSVFLVGTYFLSKDAKALKEQVDDAKKKNKERKDRYEFVKPRLEKAAEITQRQLEIQAQVEQPSMNALHSKHKNMLIAENRKLEEEKRQILGSIIADGYDPEVTVNTPMGLTKVLLSEYLRNLGIETDPTRVQQDDTRKEGPSEPKQKRPDIRKVGKFFVIKGGKGDKSH